MGSTRSEGGQWLDTVKDIVVDPAMVCTDMNSFIGKCGNKALSGEGNQSRLCSLPKRRVYVSVSIRVMVTLNCQL